MDAGLGPGEGGGRRAGGDGVVLLRWWTVAL